MPFRKKDKLLGFNDDRIDDHTWWEQGEARFEAALAAHDGTPEDLVAGQRARLAADDPASAVRFAALAVERLADLYVTSPMTQRRPGDDDRLIVGTAWSSFTSVARQRPRAPFVTLATVTAERLEAIATAIEADRTRVDLVGPFRDVAGDLRAIAAEASKPPADGTTN